MMEKSKKIILYLIILIVLLKIILTLSISGPTIFTDEYIYTKMAQSFYDNFNFKIHGLDIAPYPPLYSMLLSISFIFNNIFYSYIFMKIINVIVSTLIIIPAYLLTKEFLDEKKALLISILIGIMPMNFSFAPYIMSENLFYTLYLSSIYLIYKSFTTNKIKYNILAGIVIGLTILTKFLGISLILIIIILFIINFLKNKLYLKQSIIIGLFTSITLIPWIINNGLKYGFTISGVIGEYSKEVQKTHPTFSIINLLIWIIVYITYLILASGFFITFINLNWKKVKENKNYKILFLITLLSTLIILYSAANHAAKSPTKDETLYEITGRPIGRYIDTALPILLIFSMITFFNKEKLYKEKKIILWVIPLIFSYVLFYFQLFPVNNMSLTLYGILNELLKKLTSYSSVIITILISLIFLIIKFLHKQEILKAKQILIVLTIFFITTSIINYGVTYYNYKTNWENNPQLKLSKWINDNIPKDKTIIVDQEYCGIINKGNINNICSPGKSTTLIGFWIRNNIIITDKNANGDYIITLSKLNKEIIKKTENDIYIYKTS